MENYESGSGNSQQKISHLSFLVALLQSIGFKLDTSCSSDPSDVQNLVEFLGSQDFPTGTTVTITCGYSRKKFTLRLSEEEETCNCLAVNENEEKLFDVFSNARDVRGLKEHFNALLKKLRDDFIREIERLKDTFEFGNISLSSMIPNFQDISRTSETMQEFNFNNEEAINIILNETYTINVQEVPRQPSSQTSLKRYPSAPPSTRPEVRRNSLLSKSNKNELKVSPKPKFLEPPYYNGKSPSQASVKSENYKRPESAPKSPSRLSIRSENLKHSTRDKLPTLTPVKPENSKGKKPMDTKLKSLGATLKNSTIAIRRSIGLTSHNKYVTNVKLPARHSLDSQKVSSPIPNKKLVAPSPRPNKSRSSSTDRYSKIPMSSSGMARSQSGMIPKLN